MEGPEGDFISQLDRILDSNPSFWTVTSVYVYTTEGLPIFSVNNGSKLENLDSDVVLQFHDTVQSFAENNLNTRLVDFKVRGERVFFKLSNDHIYIVTARLGPYAKSGLSSMLSVQVSSFISEVSTILFFNTPEDPLEPDFEFKTAVNEMIVSMNQSQEPDQLEEKIEEVSIGMAVITDDNGIPLISKVYEKSQFQQDSLLMVMMLHALNVFFNTHFSDELEEINFGNSRLYIKNIDGYFYAISIQFPSFPNIRENSPIHSVSKDLIDQMRDLLFAQLGDLWDHMHNSEVELMVDNFVFKATFQLNGII
ncbi:MAG: hypothetical protein ACXAE3_02270 [Candidatus Kariarchaeaceae archaeon]|jgi:hypothetical protein